MLIYILITFSVFILAVIFLFRLVFRRDLDSAVTRLKKLQEETMLKEGYLTEALEAAKTEKALQIEQGKKEAKNLTAQAEKKIEKMLADAGKQAEQEKAEILQEETDKFEELKKSFHGRVKAGAAKMAVEMIRHIFTEKNKEQLQHQLIEEFLEDLQKIGKDQFTVNTNKGTITASLPLTSDEMCSLQDILSEKIGSKVDLETKNDPSLITGIVVTIGDFIIDGSLRNKLNKVI